jgi:hypothetical protein
MTTTKITYDEDADVLYVKFDRSEHVTGVELSPSVLLRLDTGKATGLPPRALGLTFVNFSFLMAQIGDQPLNVPLGDLRYLPKELWQAVLEVVTTAPVSDFLTVGLSLLPQRPPLPTPVAV